MASGLGFEESTSQKVGWSSVHREGEEEKENSRYTGMTCAQALCGKGRVRKTNQGHLEMRGAGQKETISGDSTKYFKSGDGEHFL